MATPGRIERRLVAILAPDVADYGRLMGADEAARAAPVAPDRRPDKGSYIGRILKTTGDGLPESGESGGKGSNNPPDREPLAVTVPSFIGMKLPRVGK
jgi:hypothetical protein